MKYQRTLVNKRDYDVITKSMMLQNYFSVIFVIMLLYEPLATKGDELRDETLSVGTAKEYLSRFGWIEPSEWINPSLHQIIGRHPQSTRPKLTDDDVTDNLNTADLILKAMTSSAREVSDERFSEALCEFQKANGLNVTGIIDEQTSFVMKQPRCGVPDQLTVLNYDVINATNDRSVLSRSERSIEISEAEQNYESGFSRRFLKEEIEAIESRWKEANEKKAKLLTRILKKKNEDKKSKSRKKRSDLFKLLNDWKIPRKNEITWRLSENWPSTNHYMTKSEVWVTIKLAFRMWSEILPKNFIQSSSNNQLSDQYVDILLGFAVGQHNECPATFDTSPYVREFAHAWPLPWAQVHFNDDELFVPFSWQAPFRDDVIRTNNRLPISLLKVALHEIGHALGLKHSTNRSSIMYPFYKPFQDREVVELSDADLQLVREIYGPCNTRIDSMFDMVFPVENAKGDVYYKFQTYIFRKGWFWLYQNKQRRPYYGSPKTINKHWRGLMIDPNDLESGIDAVVQAGNFKGGYGDAILFFVGEYFIEYDIRAAKMKEYDSYGNKYPRKIRDAFKHGPSSVDAVLYKKSENLIYLFKDSFVYRYIWPDKFLYDINLIPKIFPVLNMYKRGVKLYNIDAAYHSVQDDQYYLFKGNAFWKVNSKVQPAFKTISYFNGPRTVSYLNPLSPGQPISNKWLHVCDIGLEELRLTFSDL